MAYPQRPTFGAIGPSGFWSRRKQPATPSYPPLAGPRPGSNIEFDTSLFGQPGNIVQPPMFRGPGMQSGGGSQSWLEGWTPAPNYPMAPIVPGGFQPSIPPLSSSMPPSSAPFSEQPMQQEISPDTVSGPGQSGAPYYQFPSELAARRGPQEPFDYEGAASQSLSGMPTFPQWGEPIQDGAIPNQPAPNAQNITDAMPTGQELSFDEFRQRAREVNGQGRDTDMNTYSGSTVEKTPTGWKLRGKSRAGSQSSNPYSGPESFAGLGPVDLPVPSYSMPEQLASSGQGQAFFSVPATRETGMANSLGQMARSALDGTVGGIQSAAGAIGDAASSFGQGFGQRSGNEYVPGAGGMSYVPFDKQEEMSRPNNGYPRDFVGPITRGPAAPGYPRNFVGPIPPSAYAPSKPNAVPTEPPAAEPSAAPPAQQPVQQAPVQQTQAPRASQIRNNIRKLGFSPVMVNGRETDSTTALQMYLAGQASAAEVPPHISKIGEDMKAFNQSHGNDLFNHSTVSAITSRYDATPGRWKTRRVPTVGNFLRTAPMRQRQAIRAAILQNPALFQQMVRPEAIR